MGVMPMSDFLTRARIGRRAREPAPGETQFLARPDNDSVVGDWNVPSSARGDRTISNSIIVRWGALRGVKGPLDICALYFPIECEPSFLFASRVGVPTGLFSSC
jgi:hypothetical protein